MIEIIDQDPDIFDEGNKKLEDVYSEILETIDYGDGPRLINLISNMRRMHVCRSRKLSSMIKQSSLLADTH